MDKQIISFKANEQALTRTGGECHYSSNKVSYIEAHFELGDNWSGYDSVRAVWFTDRINGISTVLDTEGNCTVPTEVLKKKDRVFVNLVGSIVSNGELTDRLTTYPAVALVVDSKAKVDSTETAPVTPSQFEQFVSIVQDAVANIKDIVSTTLNADYTLTFVYSDGTSYTTPSIRGERGPQGADGADGTDGNGIASAVLNSNYTLTLTFTDGTSYTTPSIRGAQGPKGDPGDVSQAQLDAAVSDLKSEIGQIPTSETEFEWTAGAYIKTGVSDGTVVDVNNPITNASYGYIIVAVSEGDKYRLNGTGGSSPKAWAFTDTTYHMLDRSDNDYIASNLMLTVEHDGYLIVNSLLSATHSLVKVDTPTVIEYIDDSITEVNSVIGGLPSKKSGISWINGAYIKTGVTDGTVVNTTPVSNSSYAYAIVHVQAGDKYRLSALGGSDPRTWAFTDETYHMLSKADNEHTSTDELLTASSDGYLIVNTHTSQVLYKVEPASVAMLINNVAKSITDFGAVGDGVTDDTGAIQLALTECAGGTVIIPSGTFMFSETINVPSGTKFVGEGEDSVLKLVGTGFKLTPFGWRGGQKRPLIYLNPTTSGCVLENFVLIGQPSTFYDQNVEGVSINGKGHIARSLVVHDIDYFPDDFSGRVASVTGIGISVTHASDILVENCKTYNCGYEGIGTDIVDNVTISNCKVGNACQTGIQIHMESTNIKVIGNVVEYTGITRPAFTLHADEGHDMSNIYVAHNAFGGSLAVISIAENCVSLVDNYIGGAISFSDDGYRNNWFIRGNRINGRVVTYVDKSVITDNIINISTGYYMIIHHGNTSVIDNNLGVGSVTDINIITH